MNLVRGRIVEGAEARALLAELVSLTARARTTPIDRETVIAACGRLSRSISADKHLPLLTALGVERTAALGQLSQARLMLSEEYLRERVRRELFAASEYTPMDRRCPVRQELRPLGTLLHIASGNAEALPAYSVIEGLLTGNANILKLSSDDNGISTYILKELAALAPELAEYIYVFAVPSSDRRAMELMADAADGIVVWGGDSAVLGARQLARPGVRVIEWGHRLSFAYASPDAPDAELLGAARNVCETEQRYCSSCQGVYLDTEDEAVLAAFAERLLSALERASAELPEGGDVILQEAARGVELYTRELEDADCSVIRGRGCSVVLCRSSAPEPAPAPRSCWVKPLPRAAIAQALLPYRSRLQTVGLLCTEAQRSELAELLIRAGAGRVTSGAEMSRLYCGCPHDGEPSLMRYVRVVSLG